MDGLVVTAFMRSKRRGCPRSWSFRSKGLRRRKHLPGRAISRVSPTAASATRDGPYAAWSTPIHWVEAARGGSRPRECGHYERRMNSPGEHVSKSFWGRTLGFATAPEGGPDESGHDEPSEVPFEDGPGNSTRPQGNTLTREERETLPPPTCPGYAPRYPAVSGVALGRSLRIRRNRLRLRNRSRIRSARGKAVGDVPRGEDATRRYRSTSRRPLGTSE